VRGEQFEFTSKYEKVVKSDPRSPRYFKACDVARIAANCCEDTGTPDYVVLACVAKKLGFERVWVSDKAEALQSDKWDADKAFLQIGKDALNDRNFWDIAWTTDTDKYEMIFKRMTERATLVLEREIAIDAMTLVEAFEGGVEMIINYYLYRFYLLIKRVPGGIGYILQYFLIPIIEWIAGMIQGFTSSISVDVDDVLQANTDWCTCMQAEVQDGFKADKKRAKEFAKSRKKRKLSNRVKRPNLPILTGE